MMIWTLAIALSVIIMYSAHSIFKYTRMISHIFLSLVYRPTLDHPISSVGESITILDSSDREIEVLRVDSADSKKLMVFCHESGATKESWEKYAYFFPGLGYHVLSIDLGKSEEKLLKNTLSQWPTTQDVERVLTVIRWAKKAIHSDLEIVLFGVSFGADIAFAASFRDATVKAVITDGMFSMKEIFRDYIRKWAPILVKPNLFGERYPQWVVDLFANLGFWYSQKRCKTKFMDVEKLLQKPHRPLFMIHGENDDYVPVSHQVFLNKIDRHKGTLASWRVPEAKHNQAVTTAREMYAQRIADFLNEN